ncbi:MAG: HAD family phosphatase [Microthrixaceae bacterium]|nr:HAD family phosphatase [Microthrixaceae bacterium]
MSALAPQAVLWDMDGTIVDTEPYWLAAEAALVVEFGGTWSHEQAMQLVGSGLEDAARVFQEHGVRMGIREIIDHLTDGVMRRVAAEGPIFRPGALPLLRSIRDAGVPTALVTMSMRSMADGIVDLIDFEAFDLVLGGDDVPRPKPFPDPYLHAAQALGVDIARCVVIEDSPTGMRSAIASGAATVGVSHMVSLEGTGAHVLWPSLAGRGIDDLSAVLADFTAKRAQRK